MSTTAGPLLTATVEATTTATTATALPLYATKERLSVGVLTCIFGNILISVALNIQKYAHNEIASEDTQKSYVKSRIWWTGMILLGIGELSNFAAYGFAPTGLIAILGSTAVIFNAIIATFVLKERPRIRDFVGTVCAVGGGLLLVFFAPRGEHMVTASDALFYLQQYPFIIYIFFEVALFLLMLWLRHYKEISSVVIILIQVALLGSLTVASAKAVSSMLTISFSGKNQLVYPIFYVMVIVLIVTIVGQINYLNQAMSSNDATVVIPIYYIFFSLAAIVSGMAIYRETFWETALGAGMVVLGMLLSFVGVYLISGGRETDVGDESCTLLNETDSADDEKEHTLTEMPLKGKTGTE